MSRRRCKGCKRVWVQGEKTLCKKCTDKLVVHDPHCKKCGREMRPSNVHKLRERGGMCGECWQYEPVLIKCPKCKTQRTVTRRTALEYEKTGTPCRRCAAQVKLVPAVCNKCGRKYNTQAHFSSDYNYNPEGLCQLCRNVVRNHSASQSKTAMRTEVVSINGCRIRESSARICVDGYWIARCAAWFVCPTSEQCLDEAAKRGWEGLTND